MKNVLYIDGQNFIGKLKEVFEIEKKPFSEWHKFDFNKLLNSALEKIEIDDKIIYFAKLNEHPKTSKKSKKLIEARRLLKTHLSRLDFKYIASGNVRGHIQKCDKRHETLVFKEKGVDTRMCVDLVVAACDKTIASAIIASSDSDLQPAIKELRKRRINTIYLGFEVSPNKGISYTTNRTILIRNSEVLNSMS